MPKAEPFERHADQYEAWFEQNRFAYESELAAIKALLPGDVTGVEVGVGTGRFAAPLGIKLGVEPSPAMRAIAQQRGVEVRDGVAEVLPFGDARFDLVLMVTTICFLDDVQAAIKEAHRVLKPGGALVIGLIDRDSPLGIAYEQHKQESVFYKEATFHSVDEVVSHLQKAGFRDFVFAQTIFRGLSEIQEIEPVKDGYGEGSFVVVRGIRPGFGGAL